MCVKTRSDGAVVLFLCGEPCGCAFPLKMAKCVLLEVFVSVKGDFNRVADSATAVAAAVACYITTLVQVHLESNPLRLCLKGDQATEPVLYMCQHPPHPPPDVSTLRQKQARTRLTPTHAQQQTMCPLCVISAGPFRAQS